MPSTPTINSPLNNTSGLGRTPLVTGTAEANHGVEIWMVDYGLTPIAVAVAGGNGHWETHVPLPANQWYSITARSYSYGNPGVYSEWHPPHNLHE